MGQINKTVETILEQMGGFRFIKMVGAHNLTNRDKGTTLGFHFRMCRKANICLIHLNGMDLYDIEFHQYSKKNFTTKKKEEYNDIYAEDLQRIFTEYTGLDTHL
jgi:hypothetical protein